MIQCKRKVTSICLLEKIIVSDIYMGIPLRPNNIVAEDINNYNNLENKQTSIGHNNLLEKACKKRGCFSKNVKNKWVHRCAVYVK